MKIKCRSLAKTSLILLLVISIFSCSKTREVQPQKQEYVQHFRANVAGSDVLVENSMSKDRTKLKGQWTGLGNGDGTERSIYTVDVVLPAEALPNALQPQLRFQIEHVAKGKFLLTGENSYYSFYKSFILLYTQDAEKKMYTANTSKKPFEVEITRYEYVEGSMIPIVGGKLNGVLYNEKNAQDSIVIKNGLFEVRF